MILQSITIVIIQILFFSIFGYLVLTNQKIQLKIAKCLKFIFMQVIYSIISDFTNNTSKMRIEELLCEKLNNYIKFSLNSSLKPENAENIIQKPVQVNEIEIRCLALSQSYFPFITKDGDFDVDKYTKYWLKKYNKKENEIEKEDLMKFKNYHLMFFDLINKYQKELVEKLMKMTKK